MEFISVNIYTNIGIFGVIIYLINYTCLQMGLISGQSYLYAAVVILGASCILISLLADFNLPTAIIQCSFILISITGILRLYILENYLRFSKEEMNFITFKFPNLPKSLSRKLLDKGCWVNSRADTVLATEGEKLKALAYISEGEAAISINGEIINYVGNDSFIGELTVLEENPATATVVISKPSRYFLIDKIVFKKLILRYPEIRQELTHSFVKDMRDKLLNRDIDPVKLNEVKQEG